MEEPSPLSSSAPENFEMAADGGPCVAAVQVSTRGDPGNVHERPLTTESRGLREVAHPEVVPGRRSLVRPMGLGKSARQRAAYATMVSELKTKYKISIRKWRGRMSGVAYELTYRDGRIKRLITAPRPRSPVSAAIFLHEVGHHAVGFKRYSPRCLEEYYVWQWTFREMTARNIPVTERVLRHYRRSMYYYVRLARKHGGHLPHEVVQFAHWPG
jgi:hypothetical protein